MKALEFQFHPEQVRISAEEILADLHYPARKSRPVRGQRRVPRRRGRA